MAEDRRELVVLGQIGRGNELFFRLFVGIFSGAGIFFVDVLEFILGYVVVVVSAGY